MNKGGRTDRICALCDDGKQEKDGTFKCKLPKRKQSPFFSSCQAYIGSEKTTFTRQEVQQLIQEAKKYTPVTEKLIFADIPLEITSAGYPSDACFAFANVNLEAENQKEEFIQKYVLPFVPKKCFSYFENERQLGFDKQLREAQKDLQDFFDGKLNLEKINNHLRWATPKLVTEKTNEKPFLKPSVRFGGQMGVLTYGRGSIAMFFVQAIEYVRFNSPVRRCPVCMEYFQEKAGPPGATCGKKKCKNLMNKRKRQED